MRRRFLSFLLPFALMASSAGLNAAGLPAPVAARLDAELSAIANDPQMPLASLAVLAIRNGEVVYQQSFGARHIDLENPANSKPANAETLFRIASISKLVTAVGVMRLVEEGKLDLDADVSRYLGFTLRNPAFPERVITLRHLMSHTSSLRDDAGYNFDWRIALREFLVPGGAQYGKGAAWSASQPPGYFHYVNLNWGVIGTAMEGATGERYDRLMQRLVLAPLGMGGGFHAPDFSARELDNLATLYRRRVEIDGKEIWRPDGPWVPQTDDYSKTPPAPRAGPDYVIGSNGTAFGPQGSLRASAAGLGKLMLMLMNRGQAGGKAFLKPESVAALLSTQWQADGRNGATERGLFHAWGLGVQHSLDLSGPGWGDRLVEQGGFPASGHFGTAWGLTSAFFFNPATRDGMIYLQGGTGRDPETTPGRYSAMKRHEERILDALWRHALRAP